MDINWDDQPKGYPVWIEDLDGGRGDWHRDDGDRYTSRDGCFWTKPGDGYYTVHFKPEIQWAGEGPPPVGTVCELSQSVLLADANNADWFAAGTQVEVGGHATFDGATGAVCAVCVVGLNFTGTLSEVCLRPIKTAEQIAAEERESAIKDLMQLDDIYHEQASAIYDAGYRKVSP